MKLSFVKFILLIAIVAVLIKQISFFSSSNIFGQKDLIAFWSGVSAFITGTNPYSSLDLFEIQQRIYPEIEKVKWFLNPPWSLPFLVPFFYQSFDKTLMIWPLLTLTMWIGTILFVYDISFKNKSIIAFIFISFLYLPFYLVLIFGQLDILILFFFYAAIWCLLKKRDICFGFMIFPVTLKPQLFFLFLFCLALWLIKEKRYSAIISSIISFSVFNLITLFYYPKIFQNWMQTEYNPGLLLTSTVATQLRLIVSNITGTFYFAPIIIIPLIGMIFTAIWFYRKIWILDLKRDTSFLLALSLIFTPYAWPYDFIILFPIFAEMVLFSPNKSEFSFQRYLFPCLAVLSQLILLFVYPVLNHLGDCFWYPPLILSIYLFFKHQTAITDAV